MAHPVVHFEIGGPDDAQLAEFYRSLFGWSVSPVPGYTVVDTRGGGGINGGIASDPDPRVTFYIETDDLQAALDKINLVGGKTVLPITELPGMAVFALFADPDGLVVGLVLARTDRELGPGSGTGMPVDWFEVLAPDAARSQQFYAEIFGWQMTGDSYRMVDTGTARGIRGGIGTAERANWATVYANVPDVEAVLSRAAELGGQRVYGPDTVDDHMQTGALRDPAGNVFGVYHHAPH
jgi:predicted enzyme related to lactoylglutathione lyase